MKSMVALVALVAFCCLFTVGELAIPDGFLLSVEPNCGSNTKSPANIKVISDLNFKVVYTCDGGVVKDIAAKDDSASVTFNAAYTPFKKGSTDCHFIAAPAGSGIYKIFVDVYWSRTGSKHVLAHDQQYVVTCTTNPKAVDQSTEEHPMEESKFSPQTMHEHQETSPIVDTLKMVLLDVNGRHIITPETITPGKKLRLLAMREPVGALGEEEEEEEKIENFDRQKYEQEIKKSGNFPPGVLPVDCDVSDEFGRKYQILRGGCGDGGVIPHNKGFYTFWGRSISPIINLFHLEGAEDLTFTCTFIFCTQRCDGYSCELQGERRRRETEMGNQKYRRPKGKMMNVTLVLSDKDGEKYHVNPVVKAPTSNFISQSGESASNSPINQWHNSHQTISRTDGAEPDGDRHVVVGYITPRKMAMDDSDRDLYPLNAGQWTDHAISEENGSGIKDSNRHFLPWILAYVFCLLAAVLIAIWKWIKFNQVS